MDDPMNEVVGYVSAIVVCLLVVPLCIFGFTFAIAANVLGIRRDVWKLKHWN